MRRITLPLLMTLVLLRKRLKRVAEERRLDNLRLFPLQPSKRLPLMLAAGDIHLIVQRRDRRPGNAVQAH